MEFFVGLLVAGATVFLAGYYLVSRFRRWQQKSLGKALIPILLKLAKSLPHESESDFRPRPGEEFVLDINGAQLVETRKGPRELRRSTHAFTFAVAKGAYYTGASGRGISYDTTDVVIPIDAGRAIFTTQRVLFVGGKHSREWDFAKILGVYPDDAAPELMIAVANRQRVSGLLYAGRDYLIPGLAYQIARVVEDEGWEAAREACALTARELQEQLTYIDAHHFASEESLDKHMRLWREANFPAATPTAGSPRASAQPPKKPKTSAKPAAIEIIDVVGESFYRASFDELRALLKSPGESEHLVEVELRNDPDNEYSESGKAVAVFIRDRKVGHVPEILAPKVFDALEPDGGVATLGARLWLDSPGAKPQRNSVEITLDSRLVLS